MRLATTLIAAILTLALSACGDDAPGPQDALKPAGGLVPVDVSVPSGARQAPFDTPRQLLAPPGSQVSVLARVPGARFAAFLPDGSLLVSQPGDGQVTRLAGDGSRSTWLTGLDLPHDLVVARVGGRTWVYVAATDRVVRIAYVAGSTEAGAVQDVVTGLPSASSKELRGRYNHALKNIAVRGDRLYVSIASTCNVCAEDRTASPERAAIHVIAADGTGQLRVVHRGLRNAEGLDWDPTGRLWVAVNNRDQIPYPFDRDVDGDGQSDLGKVLAPYVDDHPPEELTPVVQGGDTGWPDCNPNPDTPTGLRDMPFTPDPEFNPGGTKLDCSRTTRVAVGMQAHSAPLGLSFLDGSKLPQRWAAGLSVVFHGSWNRTKRTGYKVVWFPWDAAEGTPGAQQDLLAGFLDGQTPWGRPVDAVPGPDGALYVTDDESGTVYRVRLPA